MRTRSVLFVFLLTLVFVVVLRLGYTIQKVYTPRPVPVDLSDRAALPSDDLVYFVQVSDLHLSKFRSPERVSDLSVFCKKFLSETLKPAAVVVTGDITDAKDKSLLGSAQYVEEWSMYKQIVDSCSAAKKSTWLDIRGNHDAFDVASDEKEHNPYLNYSAQGAKRRADPRFFMEVVSAGKTRVAFVAVDATPSPGLKRPFNFFGVLDDDSIERVRQLRREAAEVSDRAIFFGHYPTSTIGSGADLRTALGSGAVYLCGHLHTILGFCPHMMTRHESGLLELELGDWKDNRVFRLMAVDGGVFSFADFAYDAARNNTAVLVTSPKDSLFLTKGESLDLLRRRSEARALVFSEDRIHDVLLVANGRQVPMQRHSAESPLFTAPFDFEEYQSGQHVLTVRVTHGDGSSFTDFEHEFSLDGMHSHFPLFARVLLMTDWKTVSEIIFLSILATEVVVLFILRAIHGLRMREEAKRIRLSSRFYSWPARFAMSWLRKFWIVSATDSLFVPLVIFAVWSAVGPWTLGYVMSDRIGIIFPWGVILLGGDWEVLPADTTSFYGIVSYAWLQAPFLLVLACAADRAFLAEADATAAEAPSASRCSHLGFVVVLLLQVQNAFTFYMSYGFLALLGQYALGRAIFSAVLYRRACILSRRDFTELSQIWPCRAL